MTGWVPAGTVELLRDRVFSLDPHSQDSPLKTYVYVFANTFTIYNRYDAFAWLMLGVVNEKNEKIGDGLYTLHQGDNPTGLPVVFPSRIYGRLELAEFMNDPLCQPGPEQRYRINLES